MKFTGTKSPRMEKQKAPINPINGEIVGTATANKTAAVTKTVLKKIKTNNKITTVVLSKIKIKTSQVMENCE